MMKFNSPVLAMTALLTLSLSSCGKTDVRQMNQEIKQIEQTVDGMVKHVGKMESNLKDTIERKKKLKEQLDREAEKSEEEAVNE
jgi:hypothetical protein